MKRWQLAAALVLLWCALQAWGLIRLGGSLQLHLQGWTLLGLMAAVGVGLWLWKSWARLTFFLLGAGLVGLYVVGTYASGFPCRRLWSLCSLDVLSQPLLVLGTAIVLLWLPASNYRLERP